MTLRKRNTGPGRVSFKRLSVEPLKGVVPLQRFNASTVQRVSLRPQRDHFAQHAQTIAKETYFAAFGMVPTHWNFADPQTGSMREIKQLHVECEAVDPRRFNNRSARLEAKRFKSALCVPKWQSGREPHQQIKNTAALFSPPWLMHPDQGAIQSARAKCNVHFTICNRFDQLWRLLKWRGKIGIRKKPDRCSCSKQPRAHCSALPAIWKVLDQTCGDLCRLQSFTGDCCRCIGGSVVHNDQFALRRIGGEIISCEAERLANAAFFVETRNDDGERR